MNQFQWIEHFLYFHCQVEEWHGLGMEEFSHKNLPIDTEKIILYNLVFVKLALKF